MGTPQWIIIVFALLELGFALAKHGEDRGQYNFFATLIDNIIILYILSCGGFFN